MNRTLLCDKILNKEENQKTRIIMNVIDFIDQEDLKEKVIQRNTDNLNLFLEKLKQEIFEKETNLMDQHKQLIQLRLKIVNSIETKEFVIKNNMNLFVKTINSNSNNHNHFNCDKVAQSLFSILSGYTQNGKAFPFPDVS